MGKVSIVIPAYNEEKRIGGTLGAYSEYFNRLKLDYEILIVINNTQDKTEEIVKEYIKKNPLIRYLNFKKGGKGFAVIEGFKDALTRDNDLIGFVDADMATPPEEYYKLIKAIRNFDGAIADRYLKNSRMFPPVTFRRVIVSRLFNILTRAFLLMPYKDTQCGAKLFKRNVIIEILPLISMSQWAFDVDLLYQTNKKKFKIIRVATQWFDKTYSKINFWSAGPWMALGVIRLRILNSPFKKFVKIYDKFIKFIPK